MAVLKYKTRGMSSPQGLSRVYFSCHPQDFEAFFESVSDEILEKQNCAIYYDCEPNAPFDEELLLSDLSQMQLFVMPVTTKLLTDSNRAIDVEFKFAMQQHIPVLPLMQERGLEALFNQKCGDLQFLDKNNSDATAISYDEKLEKYLAGIDVEVGNVCAVKSITASAEAGLTEATEKLVQMYRNGKGVERDYETAILWQKKLVEQFEKTFSESKTTANALNVFNAVWDLGNYIYELSRLSEAKAVYEKMQKFSLENETVFGENLCRRNLSICFNYLGNIAEAEGDLQQAKEYYMKSLKIRQQLAEETKTTEAGRDLSVSYDKLGCIAESECDLQQAKEYYLKSLEIVKKLAEKTKTMKVRRDLSVGCNKLGCIAEAEGDLQQAKEYYMKGLEIRQQLAEETETTKARRDLAVSYDKLGNIARADGDLQQAKGYYMKSLKIRRQLAEETKTIEAHRDLSVSYDKLGNIAKAEGDLQQAKEYYLKDLEIAKQLAKETKTTESRRDLAVSYVSLGNIAKAEGDLQQAKEYYLKNLEISKQLAEETKIARSYDNLAFSCYKTGCLKPYDVQMLKKAYAIWSDLHNKCPQSARFIQLCDILKNILSQLGEQ